MYYTILYYTTLHYTILYYTILYYAMLCHAMLCYAMLCYMAQRRAAGRVHRSPPGWHVVCLLIYCCCCLYYHVVCWFVCSCSSSSSSSSDGLLWFVCDLFVLVHLSSPGHAVVDLQLFMFIAGCLCCYLFYVCVYLLFMLFTWVPGGMHVCIDAACVYTV